MIFDGQGQSDLEFSKHVANSLGAFATTNLWLVDQLKEQFDQNFFIVEQFRNELQQTEVISREKVNSELTRVKQSFEK
jgi:hypothetical protein